MAIKVDSHEITCYKCGAKFGKYRTNFPVSHSILHKGVGYTHICKTCVDALYNEYLSQCGNPADAIRQVCRKLDLYWSQNLYERAEKTSSLYSIMLQYLSKVAGVTYAGKSYDDTLAEEGTLWKFKLFDDSTEIDKSVPAGEDVSDPVEPTEESESGKITEIPKEVIAFWGTGYTPDMYEDLEQRRSYWMSRLPSDIELDIGTEAIIKQICSLELDINRDRAAGRAVDKNVNTLNTLLGSASLKPVQKKDPNESSMYDTPMGVWLDRFEFKRPLPEVDSKLKDADGIVKYLSSWVYGHLSKMFNIKNANTKLYEEELEKYRVAMPKYNEDDDDELMYNVLSNSDSSKADGDAT